MGFVSHQAPSKCLPDTSHTRRRTVAASTVARAAAVAEAPTARQAQQPLPRRSHIAPEPAPAQRTWYRNPEPEQLGTPQSAGWGNEAQRNLVDLIQEQFFHRSYSLRRLSSPVAVTEEPSRPSVNAAYQSTPTPKHLNWGHDDTVSRAIKSWVLTVRRESELPADGGEVEGSVEQIPAGHENTAARGGVAMQQMARVAMPSPATFAEARCFWIRCGATKAELNKIERQAMCSTCARLMDPLSLSQTTRMLAELLGDELAAQQVLLKSPRLLRYSPTLLADNMEGLRQELGASVAASVAQTVPYTLTLRSERMRRTLRTLKSVVPDPVLAIQRVPAAMLVRPEELERSYQLWTTLVRCCPCPIICRIISVNKSASPP